MLLVPCFLFTKLASSLTLEKLGEWWLICFFVLLNNLCGMLLGYVIVTVLPKQVGKHRNLVLAACSLGNVGQIPLALASASCTNGLDKFADRDGDCQSDSQAMVGFGISVGSIAVWTLGQHLLRPPKEDVLDSPGTNTHRAEPAGKPSAYAELDEEIGICEMKGAASSDEKQEGTEGGEGQNRVAGRNVVEKVDQIGKPKVDRIGKPKNQVLDSDMKNKARAWALFAYGLISPPIVGALTGLIVGCTPALRGLFYGANAPLWVVAEAMETISMAMIPCMLLLMGANMLPTTTLPKSSSSGDTATRTATHCVHTYICI